MSESRDEIAQLRAAWEQADSDLVAALNARARVVQRFAVLRERDPSGYYVMPSTPEVLARTRELLKEFPEEGLEPVLREVLGTCARMLGPVSVAVVGPDGGLAHLAARRWFGSRADCHVFRAVEEVFVDLDRQRSMHAVVPFETSSDGALSATLRSLAETSAKVVGELTLPTSWSLYSRTGNAADVEKIYGAGTTLAACEKTLRAEFPRASLLDVPSGIVASQLALEDHGAAALGSELLAVGNGELRIVRKNLEDERGAQTRFLILGHQQPRRTGTDRTMVVLALGEEPGSLYAALQPFAERGINLTRVESRPSPSSAWNHVFFLELDGHVSDRTVLAAIDEVKSKARHAKVLGSYPRPQAVLAP